MLKQLRTVEAFHGCIREILGPCFGADAKPPVTAHAGGVGELERRDGEESFPRETGRDGLGRFDKPLRGIDRE